MVGVDLIALLGLGAVATGWLARRDTLVREEVEEVEDDVDELDTAFARLATRLFGHPEDESDRGLIAGRGSRVEDAERSINSLEDKVQEARSAAEHNGEQIEHLDQQVSRHAEVTREALVRIEDQLDGGIRILPEELTREEFLDELDDREDEADGGD